MDASAGRRPPARSALRSTWAAIVLVLLTGCLADLTTVSQPNFGFVRVTVVATGGDLDADGYVLTLDAGKSVTVKDVVMESFYVQAGTHVVSIGGVAANCSVVGATTRTVTVARNEISTVPFELVCVATGLAVTMRTTGPDIPDNLRVSVDDKPAVPVGANGSVTIGRLSPGTHTVTITGPAHCTVAGGGRVTATVVASTITPLPFDVACVPATRLPKIAYSADLTVAQIRGRWIELVNPDGSGVVTLEKGDSPAWSPDGTRIASSDAVCDDYYYYYYACSGGVLLLDPELGNVNRPPAGVFGFNPSWAPSGSTIAVDVRRSSETDASLNVFQIPSSGATPLGIVGPTSQSQPAWSPDGRRIAFSCRYATSADICIVNADGTGLTRINDDLELDLHPAWSPDGRKLVFARYPVGRSDDASADVVVLDVATRQRTTLGKGADPAWSPDGSKLVFAGADGIFAMNADGSARTRVTTGQHHAPAWRPK
jgi:hypothetical protein